MSANTNLDQNSNICKVNLQNTPNSIETNELYKIAVNKFKSGDYINAIKLFQNLNIRSEEINHEYIKCLAGSYHANKEYSVAYFWYQYAYSIDNINNIDCLYYMALLKFEEKKLLSAKTIFKLFLANSNNAKHITLIEKAKIYLEMITLKEGKINVN
jgi:hypothetical protein